MYPATLKPSRLSRIHSAVQVAVDYAFGQCDSKSALRALDKACTHSELSDTAPLASAIRLLVFYADYPPDRVPEEDRAARLDGIKRGIKRLAGLMLGHVGPSTPPEPSQNEAGTLAPDFKKRAAGDHDDE
jgi:HEAT repeat protein